MFLVGLIHYRSLSLLLRVEQTLVDPGDQNTDDTIPLYHLLMAKIKMYYISTGRGPIIKKLYVMYKHTGILGSIFEEDNCDNFIAREQNYRYASLHI